MSPNPVTQYDFFLGGHDLEMVTIRELLEKEALGRIFDKHLSWGAKASDYSKEITDCLSQGRIPVLIELDDDLGMDGQGIVVVDHHGRQAGADKPTSLHQVFHLLGLPEAKWTRWHTLVAANDRGHIPELLKVGATREEVIQIRAADRRAQGITEEEEEATRINVSQAQTLAGGRLTVIYLPHSKTAAAADRMELALGGSGYRNLLVISPKETNFFGEGKIIEALKQTFPESWSGGALPERGFWGIASRQEEVLPFLVDLLNRSDG